MIVKKWEEIYLFLTGVPGAGKTLAGLNIGASRQKYEEEEHAVFYREMGLWLVF